MSSEKPWINISDLRSFCDNDKYSCWKRALGEKNEPSEIDKLFAENSMKWENKSIKYLEQLIGSPIEPCNVLQGATNNQTIDYEIRGTVKTLQAMRNADTIIYKAYLSDKEEKFRGVADLLIRDDYIPKIFPYTYVGSEKSGLGNYYYIPVSLKFLSASSLSPQAVKKYKIELFGYCKILYKIQGVFSKNSFIIGKKQSENPYTINFSTKDNNIVRLFYQGIEWLRDIKTNCKNWTLCPDLYPNLKSKSTVTPEKLKIAEEVGEITEIFYCGYWNRTKAFDQGITSWKDPLLNAQVLQIKEDQKGRVEGILKINRGEFIDKNNKRLDYYPTRFTNNINNWKDDTNQEMYVDFETIRNNLDLESQDEDEFIFLIGVYYRGTYTSFIMENLTLEDESVCVKNFKNFWISMGKPRIFYWYAEVSMWDRCIQRHCGDLEITHWIDLYEIFYTEPFFVRGCKNFKLKSYIKALYAMGKIETAIQPEDCCNGLDAMVIAWKFYNKPKNIGPITRRKSISNVIEELKTVIEYNKMDCIYVETLLIFIRNL